MTEARSLWYFDLHSHSTDASDDAGGTVEGYVKWIVARRKRGYHIDGFVLTEHRQYDPDSDYTALSEQYGVTVLRGAEVETDIGHVLVYGITPEFTRAFDLRQVSLPHKEVFRVALETGGYAVAAHAGRPRIGLAHYIDDEHMSIEGIRTIEQLNGGSSTLTLSGPIGLSGANNSTIYLNIGGQVTVNGPIGQTNGTGLGLYLMSSGTLLMTGTNSFGEIGRAHV